MILLLLMAAIRLPLQEDDDSLARVSRSFRDSAEGQGTVTVVLAVGFFALLVVAIAYSVLSTRRSSPAWRIFREFADASGLTSSETRLFISVAERVQPDNPPVLFVKRSLFESAVRDLGIDVNQANVLRQKVYAP